LWEYCSRLRSFVFARCQDFCWSGFLPRARTEVGHRRHRSSQQRLRVSCAVRWPVVRSEPGSRYTGQALVVSLRSRAPTWDSPLAQVLAAPRIFLVPFSFATGFGSQASRPARTCSLVLSVSSCRRLLVFPPKLVEGTARVPATDSIQLDRFVKFDFAAVFFSLHQERWAFLSGTLSLDFCCMCSLRLCF
jgi:hypothetical protein